MCQCERNYGLFYFWGDEMDFKLNPERILLLWFIVLI